MTAVPLTHLVVYREEADGLWVEAFVTVGVSNAVRAGEPVDAQRNQKCPGTINIILVTNASVARPAMVEMVQVATESKTATLLAERVRSCTGQAEATGTGTDALVIVRGEGPRLRYSGTHTPMGAMVGRVVARSVQEGLERWRQWVNQTSFKRGYSTWEGQK
jgi:iron complex transport system ATP-binding protein